MDDSIANMPNIIPEDIWIEAKDSAAPNFILTHWLTEYLTRIKSLPQNHERAFKDFEIAGVETADVRGDWLLGYVTFEVKSYGDPTDSLWLAGSGSVGAGGKTGWIVDKRQEVVLYHDIIDGTWHCKGYGTGGYNLDDYVTPPNSYQGQIMLKTP
jgi:hypothetical protein